MQARDKIAGRGAVIGIDQAEEVAKLERAVPSWQAELEAVRNPDLEYPSYYTQPFHAHDEGNLCWQAAFQVSPPPLPCPTLSNQLLQKYTSQMFPEMVVEGAWRGGTVPWTAIASQPGSAVVGSQDSHQNN